MARSVFCRLVFVVILVLVVARSGGVQDSRAYSWIENSRPPMLDSGHRGG